MLKKKVYTRRSKIRDFVCPLCIKRGRGHCSCKSCMKRRAISQKRNPGRCNNCERKTTKEIEWNDIYRYGLGWSTILVYSEDPRERKRATWYVHNGKVFFRCWICEMLHQVEADQIDSAGYTKRRQYFKDRCFQCTNCKSNNGLYFEDWGKFRPGIGQGLLLGQ